MRYQDLNELQRRPVRAGYLRLEKKYLTDDTFKALSPDMIRKYSDYGTQALKREDRNSRIMGYGGLAVLIIGFFVWMGNIDSNADRPQPKDTTFSSVASPSPDSNSSNDMTPTNYTAEPEATTAPSSDDNCNPNYDPCLPDVYDLDCPDVGRSVDVIGYDEYRLDADNDGTGCDSY